MDKKKKFSFDTKRNIFQLVWGIITNSFVFGFTQGKIYTGKLKNICLPGLNCYSCPGAVGSCPIGSLQAVIGSRNFKFSFYVVGFLVFIGAVFGRFVCGWLCPFGLVQDLLHKIPFPKKIRTFKGDKLLRKLKYVILALFVIILPMCVADVTGLGEPWFCKYICPAGTLEGGIPLVLLDSAMRETVGFLYAWKFTILAILLLLSVVIYRPFCKYLCPLGGIYALFNKISVFGVKVDNSKCINCDKCIKNCKLDVLKVGDQECISCGECMDVCPTNAIKWKGIARKENEAGIPSNGNKKMRTITRGISAVLLIGLLVGAICYYWVTTPDYVKPAVGSEVGDSCISYDVTIIDETGILTETIDPTTTGKITIINFWGTWCGPCVKELPYFDQIASDYADDVVVIAIHTSTISETAPPYIAEHYPDSKIIFGKDDGEGFAGAFYSALGGRDTYPYTVILDEHGVIAKIFVNALHYEDLAEVIEELKK